MDDSPIVRLTREELENVVSLFAVSHEFEDVRDCLERNQTLKAHCDMAAVSKALYDLTVDIVRLIPEGQKHELRKRIPKVTFTIQYNTDDEEDQAD